MSNKVKWLIGIGILILIVIVVVSYITYRVVFNANLELYTFNERTQLLKNSQGVEYRNLQEHFMNYEAIEPGKKIGKTEPLGSIYEIKGQENHDWIYVDDEAEMSIPEVRIRNGMEPITIENLKPTRVVIVSDNDNRKQMATSTNKKVVNDMMMKLLDGKEKFLKKVDGEINSIWLEDPRMKGIAYVQQVLVTKDHHVYLADINTSLWHELSGHSKNWILETVK